MKQWKKNLTAAGVLFAVCIGIYTNWVYTNDQAAANLEDTLASDKILSENGLVIEVGGGENEDIVDTVTDYFAAVRLSRQQARDSAVSLLQEAMAYGDKNQIEVSSEKLEEIIETALSEAQIESLVIAKGYKDCVAYMSEDGISVAVASPEGGLQNADVSLIADIVLSQSSFAMADIRIVEVQ